MEDTNKLIKNVAVDIIMTSAIWGINQSVWGICHSYAITKPEISRYVSFFYYYSILSGVGVSLYCITKYRC